MKSVKPKSKADTKTASGLNAYHKVSATSIILKESEITVDTCAEQNEMCIQKVYLGNSIYTHHKL